MDINRFLPNDEYQAAVNASAPTALNPFATIADIAGGGGIYGGNGSLLAGTTTVTMAGTDVLQFDSLNGPVSGLFTVDAVNNRVGFGTATPGYGAHFLTGDLFVENANAAIGATPPQAGYKLTLATDDSDGNNHRGQRVVLGGTTAQADAQIAAFEVRDSGQTRTSSAAPSTIRGYDMNLTGGASTGTWNVIGLRVKLDNFNGTGTINKYFGEFIDGNQGAGKVLADISGGNGLLSWADPNTLVTGTNETLSEVLDNGNTTGNFDIIASTELVGAGLGSGLKYRTNNGTAANRMHIEFVNGGGGHDEIWIADTDYIESGIFGITDAGTTMGYVDSSGNSHDVVITSAGVTLNSSVVGGGTFQVNSTMTINLHGNTLSPTGSGNTYTLQNASGTIAYLSDIGLQNTLATQNQSLGNDLILESDSAGLADNGRLVSDKLLLRGWYDSNAGVGPIAPVSRTIEIYNNVQATTGQSRLYVKTPIGSDAFQMDINNGASTIAYVSSNAIALGAYTTLAGAGVAIGSGTQIATEAVAIGTNANASTSNSVAIGVRADASANSDGIAIGRDSTSAFLSVSVGAESNAANQAAAFGHLANASTTFATALGYNAQATGATSIAIGKSAVASGGSTMAIGNDSSVTASSNAVGVGHNVTVTGVNGIALGNSANASGSSAIAIGASTGAAANAVSIGGNGTAGAQSVLIGESSAATPTYSTVIGYSASVSSGDSVVVGANGSALYRGATLGRLAEATGNYGVALGYDTTAAAQAVAAGYQAITTGTGAIAIGYQADGDANYAISIGQTAGTATGTIGADSISIGRSANSVALDGIGADTISIGALSKTTANNSIAIGGGSQATAVQAIAIGDNAAASLNDAVAIGQSTVASGDGSIALGDRAQATATNAYMVSGNAAGVNSTANSFGIGWGQTNPAVLFADSAQQYINGSGDIWIGDGTSLAGEGAPSNVPGTISKFTVKGDVEVVGTGTGDTGVVIEADNGNRVYLQVVHVSGTDYAVQLTQI